MSMQGFIKPEKQVYFGAFRLPLTPNQKVVLLFIIGKIYEWVETRATMQATLSLSYISQGTGIHFAHVAKALKALKKKGCIAIANNAIKNNGSIITLLNIAIANNAIPGIAHNAIAENAIKESQNPINITSSAINEGIAHNAIKQEIYIQENKQEHTASVPSPTKKEINSVVCSLENISVKEEAVSSVPVPAVPPMENTSVVVLENSVQEIQPLTTLSNPATKEKNPSDLFSDCKSISSILSSMGFSKVNEKCSAPSPNSAAPLPQEIPSDNVYKPQNELKIEKSIDTSKTEKVTPAPSGVNTIDYNKLYNLFVDNTKNDDILIHRGNFNKTVNMYLSKIENIEDVILEIANQMKTRKTNDNWTNFLTLCYEKSELKTQESKSITTTEKVTPSPSPVISNPLPKQISPVSLVTVPLTEKVDSKPISVNSQVNSLARQPRVDQKQDIITLIKSSLPVSDSAIYAGLDILEKRNCTDLMAEIKGIIATQKNANGKVDKPSGYFITLCRDKKFKQIEVKSITPTLTKSDLFFKEQAELKKSVAKAIEEQDNLLARLTPEQTEYYKGLCQVRWDLQFARFLGKELPEPSRKIWTVEMAKKDGILVTAG